ncbi:MAG: hypothetical protein LBF24_01275 [Puniceicoccales bacterium]|jgi:hypothetical protein|nr:hypothetical protein [Puniceicoccales bacterium]
MALNFHLVSAIPENHGSVEGIQRFFTGFFDVWKGHPDPIGFPEVREEVSAAKIFASVFCILLCGAGIAAVVVFYKVPALVAMFPPTLFLFFAYFIAFGGFIGLLVKAFRCMPPPREDALKRTDIPVTFREVVRP